MAEKICLVNGRLFYFNGDGKLEIYYIQKNTPCVFTNLYVLSIECTDLNWNEKDANGLCVYIFLKDMVCYLGVILKLHNDECLI